MFSKKTYLITLISCFAVAIIAEVIQSEVDTLWLSSVLGSAPSFFILIGLSGVPTVLVNKITYSSQMKFIVGIAIGALIYEVQQNLSSQAFDNGDIVAILLALFILVLSHWVRYKSRTEPS